jgi:polysaccharide deacetylase family protein (PEP-CTERM system associated)
MLNALTIDLEDWFQVSNLEHLISVEQWGQCRPRLVDDTSRLLETLASADVRATFFVLGWNARHFPDLVRTIRRAGHEIGSHGYAHRRVYDQTPEEFADDLAMANEVIAEAAGVRPRCYRAPSFSITPRSVWALEVLAAAGFEADSSVFPVRHDRYGFPSAPRLPYRIRTESGACLTEAPPSTLKLGGGNLPFSGGAYFRLLPYAVVNKLCHLLNGRGEPVIFYFHPWEIDPEIPHFRLSPFRRLLSYINLDKTQSRLDALLRSFEFGTLSEMLAGTEIGREWDAPVSGDGYLEELSAAPSGQGAARESGRWKRIAGWRG